MKKKITAAVVSAVILALFAGLAVLINKSADSIDETVDNDSIFVFEKNTKLPDGLTVFADDGSYASSPPVWRVTAPDGGVLYMSGSYHYLTAEHYPLSPAVKDAFNECSEVAVEIKNVDAADRIDDSDVHYSEKLNNGDSLRAHLTDEEYAALSDYLTEVGSDISEFDDYAPWYVFTHLPGSGEAQLSKSYGYDRIIQIMANIEDKELLSVETSESKDAYYPEMDERVLGMLIKRTCQTKNSFDIGLLDAWAQGDLDRIAEFSFSDEGLSDEEKTLWQQYLKYSLDDRNVIMTAKAEEYIASGEKVFMVVGVSHFVGDNGILALLSQKGYTIEKM